MILKETNNIDESFNDFIMERLGADFIEDYKGSIKVKNNRITEIEEDLKSRLRKEDYKLVLELDNLKNDICSEREEFYYRQGLKDGIALLRLLMGG